MRVPGASNLKDMRIALLKSRRFVESFDEAMDGGTVHVAWQVEALLKQGHSVDVFTRKTDMLEADFQSLFSGAGVWHIEYEESGSQNQFIRDFEEGQSFVKGVVASPAFCQTNFDLVIAHHWTSAIDLHRFVSSEFPIVFVPHLLPSQKALNNKVVLPSSILEAEEKILRHASTVIAVSQAEAAQCRLVCSNLKIEIIPNGVSSFFFDNPEKDQQNHSKQIMGEIIVGTVGRICKQKGFDILIEALIELRRSGLNLRLEVIGEEYNEANFLAGILSDLKSAGEMGAVKFHGFVANSKIPKYMQRWNIYVQPSRYESQGIALLEAMASGCLIVTTDLNATREFLTSDVGYRITNPPTVSELCFALKSAAMDGNALEKARASRKIARGYSWAATEAKLTALLGRFESEKRRKRASNSNDVGSITHSILKTKIDMLALDNASVFLIGSYSSGEHGPGSDIDLLVVLEENKTDKVEWRYVNGVPLDIKSVSLSSLKTLLDCDLTQFVDSQISLPVVDYLCRSISVRNNGGEVPSLVSELIKRRRSREVQNAIKRRRIELAMEHFDAGMEHSRQSCRAEAQVALNTAAHTVLEAALIGRGWTISGAKRRLETGARYARVCDEVRTAARFTAEVTKADVVSFPEALDLVKRRHNMRALHHRVVQDLIGNDEIETQVALRHSEGAVDYYAPAIQDGYLKGCIAHMRTFSGVAFMPNLYREIVLRNSTSDFSFLQCELIDPTLRKVWERLMAPYEIEEQIALGLNGIALCESLLEKYGAEH